MDALQTVRLAADTYCGRAAGAGAQAGIAVVTGSVTGARFRVTKGSGASSSEAGSGSQRRGTLLQATDVAVHFGGVRAVDGVSISVSEGELLGLVGPNGSGKSTMLGVLSGLTRLTTGTLEFRGVRYDQYRPARVAGLGIARTFQTVRLVARLSAVGNVMLGADRGAGRTRPRVTRPRTWFGLEADTRRAACEALELVGMSDYAKAVVTDLPYGLQRKVEIARALASRPDILLLDEPVAGMSQGEREALSALIKQLSEQGLTQVLVEHDVGMVTSLCPRVVVLDQGRVIAEGPPRTVMQTPQVRDAYLGGDYAEA